MSPRRIASVGMVWLHGLAQCRSSSVTNLRRSVRRAGLPSWRREPLPLEQAPRFASWARANEASGDAPPADAAFPPKSRVLDVIQSRPELGQTLFAYVASGKNR